MQQAANKRKPKVSSFFLIFGLLWILFGVPIALVGRHIILKEQQFASGSKKAVATVASKKIEESRDSKNNRTVSHILLYSFLDPSGRKIDGRDSVHKEFFERTDEGASVEIEYLPETAADDNRVIDGEQNDSIAGYLFAGLGTLCLLIGIGSLVPYFRTKRKFKRLQSEGVLADGTVTKVARGSLSINKVTQYQVHYTYTDHQGKTHSGISEHMAPEDAQVWRSNDKGKVRFDRTNPSVSMWVG